MSNKPLCVCFFGTYRSEYTRHQVMTARLRSAGVHVIECHERLWIDGDDRVQAASGGWLKPGFLWRVLRTYLRLLNRYRKVSEYDVMVVGYPGQFDIFLARLLSWMRHKPLVWDTLMSIYLIAKERQLDSKSRLTVQALRWVEKLACRLPDMFILDTQAYADWFAGTYHISPSRFYLVPLGASEHFSQNLYPIEPDNLIRVLFYGTVHPTSAVDVVIKAADLLREKSVIVFEIIGNGPDYQKVVDLSKELKLTNIQFYGRLDQPALVQHIQHADICLGSFGVSPQGLLTVQNKVFESMAMKKAVITGDSPAVREIFEHGKHIYLVQRADPQALAEAIARLAKDQELRQTLSQQSYDLFCERFTTEKLGELFHSHLEDLLDRYNR